MKKLFLVLVLAAITSFSVFAAGDFQEQGSNRVAVQQEALVQNIITNYPAPVVSYFQERRTIANWTERWDAPSIPCFVYLISYGNVIGYFVSDGKPASTRSYLTPETQTVRADMGEYDGDVQVEAPDIDGTYGENNPGIRFFTAQGTAVEWGGFGACYLYSDSILPIKVPLLNPPGYLRTE